MIRAVWNDAVLAEAVHTVRLEGNDYFPPEALRREYLTAESSATTVCPWKGTAHYYTVTVSGEVNPEAGWYYPSPSRRARQIKDHVAFWRGVRIEGDEAASVADRARAWLRGKP
ncbi:MAG: DUF427 domain-containing protein [Mycobacterium sp.]